MTVEEIRNDIEQRLAKGEHISDIRMDYKSKGVDIDDLDGEKAKVNGLLANPIRLRLIGFGIGALLAIFAALDKTGSKEELQFLFVTAAIIMVILFLFSVLKKKKKIVQKN